MIFLFAFTYHLFPARATPSILPTEPDYILALLYHMTLPLITIVMIGFGAWAYLVRNFMVGTLQEDFITVKKAIGINKKKDYLQVCIKKCCTSNNYNSSTKSFRFTWWCYNHRSRI